MKHFRKLTGPYFAWLVLFVLIPLVLIAIYAFTTSGNPVKTLNFTLMNFAKINEPTYIKVFIKSIEMGVLTTGVCLILGYPIACGDPCGYGHSCGCADRERAGPCDDAGHGSSRFP